MHSCCGQEALALPEEGGLDWCLYLRENTPRAFTDELSSLWIRREMLSTFHITTTFWIAGSYLSKRRGSNSSFGFCPIRDSSVLRSYWYHLLFCVPPGQVQALLTRARLAVLTSLWTLDTACILSGWWRHRGALQSTSWVCATVEEIPVVCSPGPSPTGTAEVPIGPNESVFSGRLSLILEDNILVVPQDCW